MSNYLDLAKQALDEYRRANTYDPEPLEAVLKGKAIELLSDALGERFWLVADEEDAAKLGEPRGTAYTAHEARRIVVINDASVVAEVHAWKRRFNGQIREVTKSAREE